MTGWNPSLCTSGKTKADREARNEYKYCTPFWKSAVPHEYNWPVAMPCFFGSLAAADAAQQVGCFGNLAEIEIQVFRNPHQALRQDINIGGNREACQDVPGGTGKRHIFIPGNQLVERGSL